MGRTQENSIENVYTNLSVLISEAKNKNISTSLAVFKPKKIHEFIYKEAKREWGSKKLEALRKMSLFNSVKDNNFKVVKKLPYKFSYKWEDENGKISTMMIEDWEIGQLYWNCLIRHNGDEAKACEDVKKKYFDLFAKKKDVYLFLGTTKKFHSTGRNPFVIIGIFYPNFITQQSLF